VVLRYHLPIFIALYRFLIVLTILKEYYEK